MKNNNHILLIFFILPFTVFSQKLDSTNLQEVSNWQVFDDTDEVMEPSDETGGVQAIYVENDSNYWVATGGLVHQVVNGVWNFQDFEDPETDSAAFNVTDIYKCPFNSHIWFSSRYYGFRMFDGTSWHIISHPELLNFDMVEFVREDKYSNILIKGSFYGQTYWYILNLKTRKVSNHTEKLMYQRYCKVVLDSDGLFTTVNTHSIMKYKNDEWIEYELPKGLTIDRDAVKRIGYNKKQLSILEQPLSSRYSKLYQIENDKLNTYENLPEDLQHVVTFEVDNAGRLWFGTLYHGFFVFDKDSWLNITLENSLVGDQGDYTFSLLDGKCWFGSSKGLYIYGTDK